MGRGRRSDEKPTTTRGPRYRGLALLALVLVLALGWAIDRRRLTYRAGVIADVAAEAMEEASRLKALLDECRDGLAGE